MGFPIRKFTDQCLLAAPRDLSQRATSFIASQCQGIHQMPFRRLISTPTKTLCATRRNKPAREPTDRVGCFRRSMLLPARISPGRGASSVTCTSSSLVHDPVQQCRTTRSLSPGPRHRVVSPFNSGSLRRSSVVGLPSLDTKPSSGLVEADGIEPTTSCLQSTRSPS